jgi:DNA-binding MarR family transcriptional regulator
MAADPRELARRIARECMAVRVRMLNRVVTRVFDDALRHHGLTTAQLNVMVAVALEQPLRPFDVARVLEIEKSTLSRNLRILEERSLVAAEPADGGGLLLRLTPDGGRKLAAVGPDWERAQRAVERLLGRRGAAGVRRAATNVRSRRGV